MITINNSKEILVAILKIVKIMPEKSQNLWYDRMDYIYGDLKGQRAVNIGEILKYLNISEIDYNLKDVIISLEIYYFLICYFVAFSSLNNDPIEFSKKMLLNTQNQKIKFLDNLVSAKLFKDLGIYGLEYSYDFNWIANNQYKDAIVIIVDELCKLYQHWNNNRFLVDGCDPFQVIHHSLFPKNLLHINGQFYSPEWLAELLLIDINWSGEGTLMDPFCGSGVFLIKALDIAVNNGHFIDDILNRIIGIDLCPIACVSARANIVYNIGIKKYKLRNNVYINIICADSILPSLAKYQENNLFDLELSIKIDCDNVKIPDIYNSNTEKNIINNLYKYGLNLAEWSHYNIQQINTNISLSEKRKNEQLFLFFIKQADFIVTNPPWIGWEYISKSYKFAIEKIWLIYDLFKSKGLEAAFLKEDLSNLALLSAWDNYLKNKGKSAVVLRPATMQSAITSRGLRRLKLSDKGVEIKLEKIRLFSNINVFQDALTETATWQIIKNEKTQFPITVIDWIKQKNRWNPKSFDQLNSITSNICIEKKIANKSVVNDNESRWYITTKNQINIFEKLQGENTYIPRMGVFTGGANAVFYLDVIRKNDKYYLCENITDRAKTITPKIKVEIEHDCIYNVVRGRDIQMWYSCVESNILCPHDLNTKMYPFEEFDLRNRFPKTYDYLLSMKNILTSRKGFAGWEKEILKKYFYTLQRIGEYTFSPYKVCWKYISSEFVTCVVNGKGNLKTILPNDKVMFIPFHSELEAYYVCGVLSSNIVRNYINSLINKRQISTSVIQSVHIPKFNINNKYHANISELCSSGHKYILNNNLNLLNKTKEKLDKIVTQLYYM
jgi:hypothetical protein